MKSVTLSALFAFALIAPVSAAPDNTLGMALLSANVQADGDLLRGSGVLSSVTSSPGYYNIYFDRSIAECTCTASTGSSSTSLTYAGGVATVNCPNSQPNRARIVTRDSSGNIAAAAFHLIVFCPK